MGHVTVTISNLFCCLTTETEKFVNEYSFIENSVLIMYVGTGDEKLTKGSPAIY